MAKKSKDDGTNKSQAIRDLYKENPSLKAKEIVAALAERGMKVAPNLVYLVIGKEKGAHSQRRKTARKESRAVSAAATAGHGNTLKTIMKVKELANEVGGYGALRQIVDALSS